MEEGGTSPPSSPSCLSSSELGRRVGDDEPGVLLSFVVVGDDNDGNSCLDGRGDIYTGSISITAVVEPLPPFGRI